MDKLRALAKLFDSNNVSNVSIHRLTQDPTIAWDTMKAKQVVQVLEPLDPLTPISEDKIRFVFLSDTHNKIERLDSFVPAGDVLLHAGDFTSIGLPKSIHEFNQYLGNLPHKVKIIIAGNHEITLDSTMINGEETKDYISKKFNILPSSYDEVLVKLNVTSSRDLLTNCIYLMDSSIDVCGIKIYGSPWQPEFHGWAFNLHRGAQCLEKWNMIPDDTDILMTHGPPLGHGDLCTSGLRAGCVELLATIQKRVKPKYHLYGHIHEGYGVTTDGQTVFINGSNCTIHYKPHNKPIVFDYPIPKGHTKAELNNLPVNNICENSFSNT